MAKEHSNHFQDVHVGRQRGNTHSPESQDDSFAQCPCKEYHSGIHGPCYPGLVVKNTATGFSDASWACRIFRQMTSSFMGFLVLRCLVCGCRREASLSLVISCKLPALRIHKDSRNSHLPSCIIAFGDYKGGEFWVEDPTGTHHPPRSAIKEPWQASLKGIKVHVKNRFVKFDPRSWHCIYPVKICTRYSAIYYALNSMERLSDADWDILEKCGFNPGLTLQRCEQLLSIDDSDGKRREKHEREGHLPKDTTCPACIRESGRRVLHYKGQDPHYRTLYMDPGKMNHPDYFGNT
eukprot:4044162-Amphidinium_carterae.4